MRVTILCVEEAVASLDEVYAELDQVYDPELGMSITELGLVYRVEVPRSGGVEIDITLTSPGCPAADIIFQHIEHRLKKIANGPIDLNLVWEPQWGPERMSESARLMLGYPI